MSHTQVADAWKQKHDKVSKTFRNKAMDTLVLPSREQHFLWYYLYKYNTKQPMSWNKKEINHF